jgi:hypothetical protein
MFERTKIRAYGRKPPEHPPVFIIGLPRSGSTFLYQLLTGMFDVMYIDNLMNLGREALYFSTWLSQKKYAQTPHNSFTSDYGNTYRDGLHAPAEAGALWYRWIPKKAIMVDEHSLTPGKKAHMAMNIRALINRYQKPLVIKNLYFATRIRLIRDIFPEAKFIHIHRSPVFTAQSIYLSRLRNVKDPLMHWWSVKYPGYESLLGEPLEVQVARQVYELDRIIKRDLSGVGNDHLLRIDYDTLRIESVERVFQSFTLTRTRSQFKPEDVPFNPGNTRKLETPVFEALQNELNRLYRE